MIFATHAIFRKAVLWRDVAVVSILLSAALLSAMYARGNIDTLLNIFRYSHDEGINAMKALMLNKGFYLYSEIWSDQPPLFSYFLSFIYAIFGNSILSFRLGVFFIFYIGMLVLCLIAMKQYGKIGVAVLASGVIFSARICNYAVLTLIGLPAICVGIFSSYFLFRSDGKKICDLELSIAAFLMAIAFLIKAWVIMPFAAQLIHLYMVTPKCRVKKVLCYAGMVSGFVVLPLFTLFCPPDMFVSQLVLPHFSASGLDEKFRFTTGMRLSDLSLGLAALSSSIWLLIIRDKFPFPAIWFLASAAVLYFHSPVWDHYYLGLHIPAILSIAGAVSVLWDEVSANFTEAAKSQYPPLCKFSLAPVKKVRLLFLPAISLFFFLFFIFESVKEFEISHRSFYGAFVDDGSLKILTANADKTNYILTDLPYYAFLVDKPVPPATVVISMKRFSTGNIDEATILQAIDKYSPEFVIFGRIFQLADRCEEGIVARGYSRVLGYTEEIYEKRS